MATKDFTEAWEELSPIQRTVAEWNEGPILILAGPGSGKTRVLTCRIARLLDGTPQERFRVLALTFTNKAADEMRNRVMRFVPGQGIRLLASTFHSFSADVLRQHGSHLGIQPNFTIYSRDNDLQRILDAAVEIAKAESTLVSNLDKQTLPVIQRLKASLIFPEECCNAIEDPAFGERMAVVYPAYEAQLARENALDFNSLILRTYQLFATFPAFAKRYQTVYPYVCIDEFQDTNRAQYALIRAFVGSKHNNLFVVADDDQIIYQWNGASYQRIEEYTADYAPNIVQLPMNYRCPPEIVELANNLISHNFLRTSGKERLEAFRSRTEADVVRLLYFSNDGAEAMGIAEDIQSLHGHELGAVAVLARNRRLLEGVQCALRHYDIPAVIAQRRDEFESSPLVWLHSLLRLANERRSRSYLDSVCTAFEQLAGIRLVADEVVECAEINAKDYLQQWIEQVAQWTWDPDTQAILQNVRDHLIENGDYRGFLRLAFEWIDGRDGCDMDGNGEVSESLFPGYGQEKIVWNDLARQISQTFGDSVSLEAFLQELQMYSKEGMPDADTVTLMTIHGAKGKEFDHVYIVGLVDDELPSYQSKQKGDHSVDMEEERRNCFVAITRTIKTLTLAYYQVYRGWPKRPSRFLFEMGLII